jgi:hypothetical protein
VALTEPLLLLVVIKVQGIENFAANSYFRPRVSLHFLIAIWLVLFTNTLHTTELHSK